MKHIAVALVLVTGPAVSADFRVLDIGAPCTEIAAQEIALGSRQVPWSPVEGVTVFAFEGKAFGASVDLTYVCSHGALLTGNYFFPIEELAAATARYEGLHKKIPATYGEPESDNTPWMRPLDSRWLQADAKRFQTTWNTSRILVTTSIMPSQPSERTGWRVFVFYCATHDPERSNKSLERTRER